MHCKDVERPASPGGRFLPSFPLCVNSTVPTMLTTFPERPAGDSCRIVSRLQDKERLGKQLKLRAEKEEKEKLKEEAKRAKEEARKRREEEKELKEKERREKREKDEKEKAEKQRRKEERRKERQEALE